ncbi:MAG: flagellar basal body protein [Actinomycetota bacterium]|nr:flagellar basal body protein [Actinomycetota bacterium]
MALFGAITTAGSGLRVHRTWLDAVADNIANVNTVRPAGQEAFRSRFVVAQAVDYGSARGVRVAGTVFGNPEGRIRYEPGHPLADAQGLVRYPDIDLGDQMTQLLVAQRGYQANLAVVERAREAYQSALGLGK